MHAQYLLLALLTTLLMLEPAGSARAQSLHPDLSSDESSRLQAAIDAQGCSGGNVVVGASQFVINGARCGDERRYDLAFDREYKLLRKDPRG